MGRSCFGTVEPKRAAEIDEFFFKKKHMTYKSIKKEDPRGPCIFFWGGGGWVGFCLTMFLLFYLGLT